MDSQRIVLICSDDMEGIFTAVYDGWRMGAAGAAIEIRTEEPACMELFCTYRAIEKDMEKSARVARTIQRSLGPETYENICYAAVSAHARKGTAIFNVLQQALRKGSWNPRIMENLADPEVNLISKLHTKVWHEFHRFYGFVRFREAGGGVLFSEIAPENDILVMLGSHFADRFPNENWMIYDRNRHKVLLHERGEDCTLRTGVELSAKRREELAAGEDYEELWRTFCRSVTVEERRNGRLQQQFVPLKFRSDMLEFKKDNG